MENADGSQKESRGYGNIHDWVYVGYDILFLPKRVVKAMKLIIWTS